MVPIVKQIASDFEGRALVGTVDVNSQGAVTRDYSVASVPTFVFFKGGHEVSRQSGTTTYEDLAGKLRALLATP
jgi:thioredoxin 1